MALIVTFTSPPPTATNMPVEKASDTNTEAIAVGAASTAGAKAATDTQRIVSLLAQEDCWVMVGSAPTAVANAGRKLISGERYQLWCDIGDKVAVIQV